VILKAYRDPQLARKLQARIRQLAEKLGRRVQIMHVCGTHEWTITHYGVRSLLPPHIEIRAGPGCPVCVTPASDIDLAVQCALDGFVVATYGDMSRAKGSHLSLEEAKAQGGDVRVVYSVRDVVEMARREPEREFVFFAVGFETTAPLTAYELLQGPPKNLSFLVSYRYVPPAVGFIAEHPELGVDAFINAGHASTISGMKAYQPYFERSRKPMVFAGFEPNDVLIAIAMVLEQLVEGEPRMENEYTRSVTWEGNLKAQKVLREAFNLRDGYWRGVAVIPDSVFTLKEEFEEYDARIKHNLVPQQEADFVPGARCAEIILGRIDPPDCPLYLKECTPNLPKGPTMVSIEGTCRIWAQRRIIRGEG
jgi:hydrogenase expression/formation protein HypD